MKKIFFSFFLLISFFLSGCGGSDKNSPPTANAGSDKTVVAGNRVTLSGVATDPDNDISRIKWTQITGKTVNLENSDTLKPTFTAPATILKQSYEFQLEVKDSKELTATDSVIIHVNVKNPDAVAYAGPDRQGSTVENFSNPKSSEIIFIDGNQSSGCSFEWSVISAPENSRYSFTSKKTPSTGFYADIAGEYILKIKADNCQGHTSEDEVFIKLIQDSDSDGVEDKNDLDRDGDSYLNNNDIFPDNRATHLDFDGDGTGNYYEDDVDGDGVTDLDDDYPLDPALNKVKVYMEATETDSSNQNDGITVSENAGSSPIKISGINYSSSGPDLDYFLISMTTGIYSVVVHSENKNMSPSVTFITSTGAPLPLNRSNFVDQPGLSAVGVSIPSDGNYYLVITDSSGNSNKDWHYTADIFPDTDMDGISNDLEKALDSNDLSPDSDGDSIPDFIEIKQASKNWAMYKDMDNDGLPPWWDMDSDGDMIPDNIEFYTNNEKPDLDPYELLALNDADGDGFFNFVDTNSDNTSYADDRDQAGINPVSPLDTDKDGIPDFMDKDNDNDGLKDSEETLSTYNVELTAPGAEGTKIADSLLIKRVYNKKRGIGNLSVAGETLLVNVVNGPASAEELKAVFNTVDGSVTQTASSFTNSTAAFTGPDNIESGLVEFYLVSGSKKTDSVPLQVRSSSEPLISEIEFDSSNSNATIKGQNLKAELTVNFTGASTVCYNSGGSDTEVKFIVPGGVRSGYVSVASQSGKSNEIWLNITRRISGRIESPNPDIDLTTLDVSLTPYKEIFPQADGSFVTEASPVKPTTISALLEKESSTKELPQYGVYLSAIIFPDEDSITLNAESTAASLIWNGLGIGEVIDKSSYTKIYDEILMLTEFKELTTLLQNKLSENPQIISEGSTELTNSLEKALEAAAKCIDKPKAVQSAHEKNLKRNLQGFFGDDAEVTPEEADDIKVYEHNDSGNITVENDTQLYLSVKITGSNGKILQNHIKGLSGMTGPQGYGLLFYASTNQFKEPKGKNAVVEVISPGIGAEYAPKQLALDSVWKKLYFRTLVERVLWPVMGEFLPLPENDFVDILWNNAPGLVDIVVTKALEGDVEGSIKSLVDLLWQDIASVPPGPITTAIAKKLGKDFAEEILAKIAAKIGAKFVPLIGQIALAAEIAGKINTGSNIAKAVVDFYSTDAVIHFNVTFPLSIEEVLPEKIRPNGKDKIFKITGSGFSSIQRGWWPFENHLKPRVKITDKDGIEVRARIRYIHPDGTAMTILIPGWFLDEYTKGPLNIEINHPCDTPDAIVKKENAIKLAKDLELTSISPSSGGTGLSATLYGVGFSANPAENQVSIGGKNALISNATENTLKVIIPTSLDPGSHNVTVKVKQDGNWSAPSNSVTYEVVQGKVSIVVCDNGGAKDDAFALYIDGIYVGTMYANDYDYCDTYNPILNEGYHSAMLVGVEAPDSIGTYSIRFNGAGSVTGSPTQGYDLTPGVRKNYNFQVVSEERQINSLKKLRTNRQSMVKGFKKTAPLTEK